MNGKIKSVNKCIEILIAEDSHTQAEYLKKVLEKYKYHITVTHNGEEALASIKKQKPDIVLSDVVMPELDGYKLC